MSDNATILMRRMGVKAETTKKGWFGRESHVVLAGECGGDEVLCFVTNDGSEARQVVSGKVDELSANGKTLQEGGMLFAVRRTPFYFNTTVEAGKDANNFSWTFKVGGSMEIRRPEAFALKFRGAVNADEPLFIETFEAWLGTIPSTIMHDKVVVDVLGVMSLQDKDAENRYVDMQYRLEQSKEVGEKVVSSALGKAFSDFFGAEGVVDMSVSSFRASSADREAAIAQEKAERDTSIEAQRAEEYRKRKEKEEADKRRQELEQRERDNDAKREEQRKQKEHELKMAELEAQTKKLQGGDTASAFAAFETISNVLEDVVAKAGTGSFADLLKDARRAESGLRLLALARDKKRMGGVTLAKKKPSFQARPLTFTTKKTPALHNGESLSSVITSERRDGYLTVLNVSEYNEIIPMLPNVDSPDVRVVRGEATLIGDDASDYIPEIRESASSGTDNLVAIVSDAPLLAAPLSPLGEALSAPAAAELVSRLETLDADAWAADVVSFTILP